MLTKRVLEDVDAWSGLTITVTFFHFGISALSGGLAVLLSRAWARRPRSAVAVVAAAAKPPPPSSPSSPPPLALLALLRLLWPLGVCQLGGFLCTNISLKFVPVSFSHTVKACECLFTAFLALVLLGQRLKPAAYAALLPTAAGVALSAASEMHFHIYGFLAAMGSNICFAARSVLSSRVLLSTRVGASTLYWLLCCLAATMLLPAFVMLGEPSQLLKPERLPLVLTLCLCGLMHFSYNLLSYQLLHLTSPVTHVVLHALRRVAVITVASTVTGQRLSVTNWAGIAVASAGVLGYAVASAN